MRYKKISTYTPLPLGLELQSNRADTLLKKAQTVGRAINLYHIGSTPIYVSSAISSTWIG